jgi:hypothetical protein
VWHLRPRLGDAREVDDRIIGSSRFCRVRVVLAEGAASAHPNPTAYMVNAGLSHALADQRTKTTGVTYSPYKYTLGSGLGMYAAEQIAEQVEDGIAATRAHVRSSLPHVTDPGNLFSLSVARAEPK